MLDSDQWSQLQLLIEHDCCLLSLNGERDDTCSCGFPDRDIFSLFSRLAERIFGLKKFMFIVQKESLSEDLFNALEYSLVDSWDILTPNNKIAKMVKHIKDTDNIGRIGKVAVIRDRGINMIPFSCSLSSLWKAEDILYTYDLNDAKISPTIINNHINELIDGVLRCTQGSVMSLFAVYFDEWGKLDAKYYHSFSGYDLGLEKDVLLVRPAITAHSNVWFHKEIVAEFVRLINKKGLKESDLQRFFEQCPHFFRGINPNLLKVYSQVCLKRDSGRDLIPDFIIEPMVGKWCDILDLKMPSVKLVKGSPNRRLMSGAVMDGIAQLKEYQRYFEDPRNRERFRELMRSKGALNVDCYHPRLNLIIGMDPSELEEDQIRKHLMTSYADINIVTYGELASLAKQHLLI